MFVLSVCSLKGGVGKTSLVLGLAAAAMEKGLTTLVVDLDPQGDATYGLGVDSQPNDVGTVLGKPKRRVLVDTIVASPWADAETVLHVMPGGATSGAFDRPDAAGQDLHQLRVALRKLDYDLVLIDAPPSLSGLTRSALVASDRAIIVAEPGAFAAKAASRLLTAIEDIRRTEAGGLQPLGIVVNRFRPNVREHREQYQRLLRTFGPLILTPPLADRAAVQAAQGERQPITQTHGAQPTAQAFAKILSRAIRVAQRSGQLDASPAA